MYEDVKDKYVIRYQKADDVKDMPDVYLFYTSRTNPVNLSISYISHPCAHIADADKFDTIEEAQEYINNDYNYEIDSHKCNIVKIDDIVNEKKEKADKESDAIIHEAWQNTSEEDKQKIIEMKRKLGGDEEVERWLKQVEKGGNNE